MNLLFLILLTIDNPVELFNQGNEYYKNGDYHSAITCYEQALRLCPNKDIYYNLGNAYFKTNKLGKAIAQYRRARLLAPRDQDIIYNLNFVRRYRIDKVTELENPIFHLLSQIFHYFSITEASVLASIFFFFSAVLISLEIIYRTRFLNLFLIFTVLGFLYFTITFMVWHSERNGQYCVIINPEIKAYSGPDVGYKEILIIHDGAEAKISEERGGYYLIQLPGGIGAWVDSSNVEKIYQ
ncbi:MAG: tetratricopeptide repeat protein [bacterium]